MLLAKYVFFDTGPVLSPVSSEPGLRAEGFGVIDQKGPVVLMKRGRSMSPFLNRS
jgi:hypothetical protein